jgi:hypothetical protein
VGNLNEALLSRLRLATHMNAKWQASFVSSLRRRCESTEPETDLQGNRRQNTPMPLIEIAIDGPNISSTAIAIGETGCF